MAHYNGKAIFPKFIKRVTHYSFNHNYFYHLLVLEILRLHMRLSVVLICRMRICTWRPKTVSHYQKIKIVSNRVKACQ